MLEHSFHVGDLVRLSCFGIAEVATLGEPVPVPLGIGRVTELGLIADDDVIVDFADDGIMQCGPDWLFVVGG